MTQNPRKNKEATPFETASYSNGVTRHFEHSDKSTKYAKQ